MTDDDAWQTYLAAARRLDVARRDAAVVAGLDRPVRAAHDDLAAVRARLVTQRTRLRELGADESALVPTLDEVTAISMSMGDGPAAVRSALLRARSAVDAAEAELPAPVHQPQPGPEPAPRSAATSPPWLRNLVVYGALAAVVLVVQLALYTTAHPEVLPTFALLFGVSLPVVAFGLGWLAITLAFPRTKTRTPLLGALVCAAPSVLTCIGVGVIAVLR